MNSMFLCFFYTLVGALLGIKLYFRQNSTPKLGGAICKAKAFWLFYTIYTWFITLPFLIFLYPTPLACKIIWGFLTLSMWLRGLAEIYMLFVSKNWTPIIGISHDLFTIIGFVLCMILYREGLSSASGPLQIFTWSLLISLIVETYYAFSFYQLMKGRTQGEEGLWYAHEEDPKFKRIIIITTIFNFPLYAATICALASVFIS